MARITKASLEQFAKEIAALEVAEATILSTEEMARYSGGRYGAYTSLGTSQSDHDALAGKDLEAKGCRVFIENSSIHVEYPQ